MLRFTVKSPPINNTLPDFSIIVIFLPVSICLNTKSRSVRKIGNMGYQKDLK